MALKGPTGPHVARGRFLRFSKFFGVRDHEKRVRDEILINSDLLRPPDPKIFGKFHENPENLIKKRVIYNVIPIGIKTTIPAIKLFLNFAKIDLFIFFFSIY